MNRFSLFFVAPVVAAIFPYIAAKWFDSNLQTGFFSADIFFLVLLFSLPAGKIIWKMPLIVTAALFTYWQNSAEAYAVLGIYTTMVFVSAIVPRKHLYSLLAFIFYSLLFILAIWGNFFYSTFSLTLFDVWGLAKFFWWGTLLFIIIPSLQVLLTVIFSRKVLYGKDRLELPHLFVIVFAFLFITLCFGINKLIPQQSIVDFGTKKFIWEICSPEVVSHNSYLQEDIKKAFPIWEKNKSVIDDFNRPTVVVLVESYGVNKSTAYTDSLLAPFNQSNIVFMGLYARETAHTQGAEWEDFGASGGTIRNKTIPSLFKDNHFQTWFIHGYDGNFYKRSENYAQFGFDSLLFRDELLARNYTICKYGFDGICDAEIITFLDSMLYDSVPKYIYWTTLDAHPPYELVNLKNKSSVCGSLHLQEIDCTYFTLQQGTMQRLALLANKYPNYRFVIRGDHRPMGSLVPSGFVQSFYYKWVPIILLN